MLLHRLAYLILFGKYMWLSPTVPVNRVFLDTQIYRFKKSGQCTMKAQLKKNVFLKNVKEALHTL